MSARAFQRDAPDPASAPLKQQSRLEAVLSARRPLSQTGCAPEVHLNGEHAPCGVCIGCANKDENSLSDVFIVSSKTMSNLGLNASEWAYVDPDSASPMQKAAYESMNAHVSGPYYANTYAQAYGAGYGASAMDAAMGGVAMVKGSMALTGSKLGPGLKKAMQPVYAAVEGAAGPNADTYIVPFRT